MAGSGGGMAGTIVAGAARCCEPAKAAVDVLATRSALAAAGTARDPGAIDIGAEGLIPADLLAPAEVLAGLLLPANGSEVSA